MSEHQMLLFDRPAKSGDLLDGLLPPHPADWQQATCGDCVARRRCHPAGSHWDLAGGWGKRSACRVYRPMPTAGEGLR